MDIAHLAAPVKALLGRILRDRITHFAAIGAVIFALAPRRDDKGRVSVSSEYLSSLHAVQAHRLGVPELSIEHAAEVDRRAIEDEVLYREALRLGLDRDDGIVRQHLIQKTLILAEDLAGASREPTREEVRVYFDERRDRFRIAESIHVIHVFATDRETLLGLAETARLAEQARPGVPPLLGDAFPRSRDVRGSEEDLAATYGDEFAEAVSRLPLGVWSDPIPSRFGWHLAKVLDHGPGRPASFEEVFDRVRLAYATDRRHEAIAHFLKQAFERYKVDIDGKTMRDYAPTRRLALRSLPSGED